MDRQAKIEAIIKAAGGDLSGVLNLESGGLPLPLMLYRTENPDIYWDPKTGKEIKKQQLQERLDRASKLGMLMPVILLYPPGAED